MNVNKKYSVEKIDSETYTDENWKEYFKIRTNCAKEKGEPLLFESWMQLKERTLAWLDKGIGIYTVSADNNSIGFFSFDILLKDEIDRRYVYFRNGLIKDLDATLIKSIYVSFMEYDPLSNFLVIKSVNGKYDFLEKDFNAEIGNSIESFELKIANAKLEVIEKWYRDYSEKFKNYDLRHYEDIPDALLEEYCDIFVELLNDMPSESRIDDYGNINPKEIKHRQVHDRKHNRCSYRYLVFDDSKLIAKTNVALSKKHPEIMYQYMTGVSKEYRKKGIGKWLKAAMFLKLTKDFPDLEVIKTETDPQNIASRELSRQMGFEKIGFKKEYLISKKSIIKELGI